MNDTIRETTNERNLFRYVLIECLATKISRKTFILDHLKRHTFFFCRYLLGLQVHDSLLINELIRTSGQFLHLLDLRSNALQDVGMSHLASQLSQYDEHHTSNNSLHKISLQANQLTAQGVSFLAKSLLHNRTLRSLNLSDNNITNEGLFLLRDALLTNRTINELILRNCRLTDQAAIALAEFIAESSTIHYIDLRSQLKMTECNNCCCYICIRLLLLL
jgi:Ran GTPase-activating protein (RanGAP) involved in mRNA processing and transport